MTDFVNSGLEAAASFITAKLSPGADADVDPIEALRSLEIDPDLVTKLTPLFEQLGFKVVCDVVYGRSGFSRKLVIVKNGGSSLYVISIHKCVLGVFTDKTFSAFSPVTYLFGQNSKIHIISRDLDAMDVGFDSIVEEWTESKKVKVIFIPWKWIAGLLRESDGTKRFLTFQQIFKLEAVKKLGMRQPTAITDDERADILKILSTYASGPFFEKPQDAMQNLVMAADFPDKPRFRGAWKGDPGQDSLFLLDWVKDSPLFPSDHTRRGQSTLGWLLKALHDQGIDSEHRKTLASIIVDRALLTDPATIAALSKDIAGS